MGIAQEVLLTTMVQLMDDGTVTKEDCQTLADYVRDRATLEEAEEAYRALLRATWGDVIDDDVVTPAECAILAAIVAALGLPRSYLPDPRALAIAV